MASWIHPFFKKIHSKYEIYNEDFLLMLSENFLQAQNEL